MTNADNDTPDSPTLDLLVENHRRFLSFLRPRVGTTEEAEEILQAAYTKAVEKVDSIRDAETAVAWFFRLLRNAVIDHYRRRNREGSNEAAAIDNTVRDWEPELERTICACLNDLIPTLKPEYAELLREVDLQGKSLPAVAATLGITSNNAGVRLHRARTALKIRLEQSCGTCTEHGCLDCTCKSSE